jgi:hypothetical protein
MLSLWRAGSLCKPRSGLGGGQGHVEKGVLRAIFDEPDAGPHACRRSGRAGTLCLNERFSPMLVVPK